MDQQQLQQNQTAPSAAPNAAPAQQNANVQVTQVPILSQAPPMPPQMMPFAAHPAVANPLFPPPVMLSNGTFLAMPEMFASQGAATQAAPPANMMPGMAAVIGSQAASNGYNAVADPTQQGAQPNQGARVPMAATSNPPVPAAPAMAQPTIPRPPTTSTLGGIPIPALPPNSSTAMQVQVAAAAAAAAAAPLKSAQTASKVSSKNDPEGTEKSSGRVRRTDLTPEEKAKQNRDRNREHARSTRLRKKAYVQKLKELVDGLHAERTEEVRKRRVAIQHLAEVQNVRRAVVRTFLGFHSTFESDPRKWMTILEDKFWFKQPVTPYRAFRRAEVEQECRVSRGVDAMIADAASVSVMVEGIGSRSTRWMHIKREDLFMMKEARNGGSGMPNSIVNHGSRFQHAVSSLSSSSGSGSSHGSGTDEDRQMAQSLSLQAGLNRSSSDSLKKQTNDVGRTMQPKKVSSSSSSGESMKQSNDFHDYHAPSLPDPKLDSGGSSPGSDSPSDTQKGPNDANVAGSKHVCTDSSSGDEDRMNNGPAKRPRLGINLHPTGETQLGGQSAGTAAVMNRNSGQGSIGSAPLRSGLPPNIAKSGGISHNIRPVLGTGNGKTSNPRLKAAPAIALPPFVGIGKRAPLPQPPATATTVGAALTSQPPSTGATQVSQTVPASAISLSRDSRDSSESTRVAPVPPSVTSSTQLVGTDETSSNSSNQTPQIQAYYHVNEDDMLLTEDVLMCPYIFRSQDAVMCGALAECIMPGMLRAHFSPRNKLLSLEMVYDAMGFMQQLERASGTEGTAQIVPSSLEMALSPNTTEARVITLAKPPFLIVSVNEAWTRITKYTQMEVEGKQMSILHGNRTDAEAAVRQGKPPHKFEDVALGRCACSANIHYDKDGREFVDFVSSYPLTNANDDITHLLHVCKELPETTIPTHDFAV